MKTNLKTLLFSLLIPLVILFFPSVVSADTCPNPSDNPCWVAKSPMPTARRDLGVATDSSGKIYAVGGYNGSGFVSTLEVYDPATDSWTTKSPVPVARNAMGFTFNPVNGKFYLAGGYNEGYFNDLLEYDPNGDNWLSKSSMQIPRGYFDLVQGINGKIYAIGGETSDGTVVDTVEEYDSATDQWTTKSSMPTGRSGPGVVAAPNGKIYVIGGHLDFRNNNINITTVEEYDPVNDTWVTKDPMSIARSVLGASINANGNIYAVGGFIGEGGLFELTNVVEEYNPITNTWATRTSFPVAIYSPGLALARDGNVYAMGGQTLNSAAINSNYAGISSSVIDLNVPLLKQTDPAWGGFVYDSAEKWAPPEPTDIARWGCALTSAAMVFRYHKITKLPNGIELTPGTLNAWLKNYTPLDPKADGYIRNGLVNWVALSRLSKLAKPQNPSFLFDALDYIRLGEDHNQLKTDLENNIPGVLGVNDDGHFIVAKGINNEDIFTINDPYDNFENLSAYSNSFKSLGRFIPSSTDLSYIMLVVDKEVDISVSSSSGELVGESFIQQPLENEETPGDFSGDSVRIFYLPDPESGDYQIVLSSNLVKNYLLDVYLYDKDANVDVKHFSGIVGSQDEDSFKIEFNKDDVEESSASTNITFDSLINNIKSLRHLGEIRNFGTYISILTKANVAKGLSANIRTKKASINLLKSIQREIERQRGRGVSENAYDILSNDLSHLINNL